MNYAIIKESIQEWIDREKENLNQAKSIAGINSPGACMAMGALDAYERVLVDISELEKEVCVGER